MADGIRRIVQAPLRTAAVKRVSYDRMTQMCHMHPNLMGATRCQPALHQAGLGAGGLEHPVMCQRRLAAPFYHRHFLAVGGIAANGGFDFTLARIRHTPHQRLVAAG